MAAEVTTQLITVAGTLGGVVLTLGGNGYLERRRARDSRERETRRLAAEHAAWLREQRVRAYAGLSSVGEEVLQFIRYELPTVAAAGGHDASAAAEARWQQLRTELRKAYNQVALFGAEDARGCGQLIWRTARNACNQFLRELSSAPPDPAGSGLLERIRAVAADLGTVGDRFMELCRSDLQVPDGREGDGGPHPR